MDVSLADRRLPIDVDAGTPGDERGGRLDVVELLESCVVSETGLRQDRACPASSLDD